MNHSVSKPFSTSCATGIKYSTEHIFLRKCEKITCGYSSHFDLMSQRKKWCYHYRDCLQRRRQKLSVLFHVGYG